MVGKSTLANIVSRKMNMSMVDVDDHVHIIGRYAPDDAHARVLESILNREHYTTRNSVGGIVVACGGYMINREDVVNVLLGAKQQGHIIVHLQRKRFWQGASKGKALYGWPFVDLSHVPFSTPKLGKAPKILSSKLFTPDKLKELTDAIYATRPQEKELTSGAFTPYIPSKLSRLSNKDPPAAPASAPAPDPSAAAADAKLSDPGSKTRAWLAEQMESSVFSEEIEALYRKARSHQFYAIYDETRSMKGNAELSARDFYTLVYRLARLGRFSPAVGGFVVSITSKTVTELLVPGRAGPAGGDRLSELMAGAEAVELRVDMLAAASYASREYLKAQYGLLRRHCPLPVIWTVRSAGQGGEFAGGEAEYALLVKLGAELGAEFIDVEACWSEATRLSIMRSRRHSSVISSFTKTREALWKADAAAAALASMAAACGGLSDAVKLVVESSDPAQPGELRAALATHRKAWPGTPAVALCVGRNYAQSLLDNAALGHVSLYSPRGLPPPIRELRRRRVELGLAAPRRLLVAAPPAASAPAVRALADALAAAGAGAEVEAVPLSLAAAGEAGEPEAAAAAAAAGAEAEAEAVLGAIRQAGAAGAVVVGGGGGGWLRAAADEATPAAIFIGEADVLHVRTRAAAGGDGAAALVTADNAEWAAVRAMVRAAPARHGVAQPARVAVVGGGPGLRACLYALESLPDARVAKPVSLFCTPPPPPPPAGAPGPDLTEDLAQDFPSCRADSDGPAGLAAAAAAAAGGGGRPAFDVVVSLLPAAAHCAIPDALLAAAGPGDPAAAPVLVVEPRELGPAPSPLAERCRALGAAYLGGGDVLREAAAEVVARLP
jgi:3-dehydroquinate dehydratase type I